MKNNKVYFIAVWVIPIFLLLVALAKLPYGYYQFLRIVICITSAYLVYIEYKQKNEFNIWVVLFGLVAILFNPVIPIYLHKVVWAFFNVICAIIYGLNLILRSKKLLK